jgi:hypothetical protein
MLQRTAAVTIPRLRDSLVSRNAPLAARSKSRGRSRSAPASPRAKGFTGKDVASTESAAGIPARVGPDPGGSTGSCAPAAATFDSSAGCCSFLGLAAWRGRFGSDLSRAVEGLVAGPSPPEDALPPPEPPPPDEPPPDEPPPEPPPPPDPPPPPPPPPGFGFGSGCGFGSGWGAGSVVVGGGGSVVVPICPEPGSTGRAAATRRPRAKSPQHSPVLKRSRRPVFVRTRTAEE